MARITLNCVEPKIYQESVIWSPLETVPQQFREYVVTNPLTGYRRLACMIDVDSKLIADTIKQRSDYYTAAGVTIDRVDISLLRARRDK